MLTSKGEREGKEGGNFFFCSIKTYHLPHPPPTIHGPVPSLAVPSPRVLQVCPAPSCGRWEGISGSEQKKKKKKEAMVSQSKQNKKRKRDLLLTLTASLCRLRQKLILWWKASWGSFVE